MQLTSCNSKCAWMYAHTLCECCQIIGILKFQQITWITLYENIFEHKNFISEDFPLVWFFFFFSLKYRGKYSLLDLVKEAKKRKNSEIINGPCYFTAESAPANRNAINRRPVISIQIFRICAYQLLVAYFGANESVRRREKPRISLDGIRTVSGHNGVHV